MAAKAKTTESKEFAIIETGGKQYLVSEGDTVRVEKIKQPVVGNGRGEFKEGDTVTFDKVLLVDNGSDTSIGEPYLKGASVTAEIKSIARAKKVEVVKYKAKSRYFKRRGHRQPYFEIIIKKLA